MNQLPSEPRPAVHTNGDEVTVHVRRGYHPDTIVARAGRSLRITFRREESSPCSERVIFPGFDVAALLPRGEDVTLELRPDEAGEYGFTCSGPRCCVGRLIVTPDSQESAGSP